jgi:hypothetical protein
LKFITGETINHFKKFISKLYKKEEEALLNKKKKREEIKQKNKFEKTRINRNGANQYNFYQGVYIPPIQPMNSQNPAYYNDIQNYYYYNTSYQFPPHMIGMPPYFPQYMIEPPKNLQENLNNIYNRGIVNNIIGAFYIKECQEKMKNNEKRRVPVSRVDLGDEQGNNTSPNKNNTNGNNNNENNINNEFGQIKLPHLVDEKAINPNGDENNNGENNDDNMNKSDKKEVNPNGVTMKKSEDSNNQKGGNNQPNNDSHHENELKKPDILF